MLEEQKPVRTIDYKFGLYAGNRPIVERIFDAGVYNPTNRYKIDLRPFNSQIISDFRNILESPIQYLNFKLPVGINQRGQLKTYRLNEFKYQSSHDYFPSDSFKYSLKICDSGASGDYLIIERNFPVKNFNRASLYSVNILEKLDDWAYEIQMLLKERDKKQLWEEYVMGNRPPMTITELR